MPKIKEGTREDLAQDLRNLALQHPGATLSRNFYRAHGAYTEAAWSRHFGTFAEFKTYANLHNPKVAKNPDALRRLTIEKQDWGALYQRPCTKRYMTVLVGSDIHDRNCDPFWFRTFLDTARRTQPDRIVLNGDIFDMPEFSKYVQDPRSWGAVERIQWVHMFLECLRNLSPDSQIDLVEGNHESLLLKHLAEASPALQAILSDLHHLSIPDLLGLNRFEVNYISRTDLTVFNEANLKKELSKNYLIIEDALLFHHFPEGRNMGLPGANGHHHKHLVWHNYSPIYGPFEWHQLGCGHVRKAAYCASEKWGNGFLLCHLDRHNKRTQFEYIDTTHGHAVIGGQYYVREPDEILEV